MLDPYTLNLNTLKKAIPSLKTDETFSTQRIKDTPNLHAPITDQVVKANPLRRGEC